MRPLLAVLLALPVAASASPMLDKCLPLAAKICGLTAASTDAEFLSCFDENGWNKRTSEGAACAEELAHARVHRDCGADIKSACKGVKPGNDRLMGCLRNNRAKVAPACLKSLDLYDAQRANPDPTNDGLRKKGRGSAVSGARC
jgi:hypothetical protein